MAARSTSNERSRATGGSWAGDPDSAGILSLRPAKPDDYPFVLRALSRRLGGQLIEEIGRRMLSAHRRAIERKYKLEEAQVICIDGEDVG